MMKISELVDKLNEIKEEHGDLPVYISHDWSEELEQSEYSGVHFLKEYQSKVFKSDRFPDRVDIS